MWKLLLIGLIKEVQATQSTPQPAKQYFQTYIEDDQVSLIPRYKLGQYAVGIAVLVLVNTGATFIRTRFIKSRLQQNKISYCCVVIYLYWQVAMTTLLAIVLHHQGVYFQTLGRASIVYPAFILVWTLHSVGTNNISYLQKSLSLFFQIITIASVWIEIYLPFRVILASYALLPLVQTIYWKSNKSGEKWNKLSTYHGINMLFTSLTTTAFRTAAMDPSLSYYFIICILFGPLLNLLLLVPVIPVIIDVLIKKSRLSLRKWQDNRIGRPLANPQVCAICLGEMDAYAVVEEGFQYLQIQLAWGYQLVRTSCGHKFHSTCMRQWMGTSKWVCPMDYTNIPLQVK